MLEEVTGCVYPHNCPDERDGKQQSPQPRAAPSNQPQMTRKKKQRKRRNYVKLLFSAERPASHDQTAAVEVGNKDKV
jgi:hypothetical protein